MTVDVKYVETMKTTDRIERLIGDLIDHTYDTGYYSGKEEDGTPHHKEAIAARIKAKTKLVEEIIFKLGAIQNAAETYKSFRNSPIKLALLEEYKKVQIAVKQLVPDESTYGIKTTLEQIEFIKGRLIACVDIENMSTDSTKTMTRLATTVECLIAYADGNMDKGVSARECLAIIVDDTNLKRAGPEDPLEDTTSQALPRKDLENGAQA